MDKISVCGTDAPGSTPGESTDLEKRAQLVCAFFLICATAEQCLRTVRQESKRFIWYFLNTWKKILITCTDPVGIDTPGESTDLEKRAQLVCAFLCLYSFFLI